MLALLVHTVFVEQVMLLCLLEILNMLKHAQKDSFANLLPILLEVQVCVLLDFIVQMVYQYRVLLDIIHQLWEQLPLLRV